MAFSPDFLDEIRDRLSIVGVVGRKVRLQKRGRNHVGLCPFHNEKTPSFSVQEDRGRYHCFGCGVSGDHFTFLMETEGITFPDAVERLAGEAGIEMPAANPADRERDARRATLADAMAAATTWYRAQLGAAAGRDARRYLEERGLRSETITAFGLGFAPAARGAAKDALIARGIAEDLLVEAGLVVRPEEGGEPRDRFRNRIMFPIEDGRGRVIAFGGRALGEARAKYLNSPETPLFRKGQVLYNRARAQAAAREAGTVIVVEGYMDVIALAQAGLEYAVAPLGTALGEAQIKLLWRMAPEPVLCFDGDAAGVAAAYRALGTALPLLLPGQSLRFAFLPEGRDPDDMVRAGGRAALESVIAGARPAVEVLWERESAGADLGTPERRAGFERRLEEAVGRIGHPKIRRYYEDEIAARMEALVPSRRTVDRNSRVFSRRGWREARDGWRRGKGGGSGARSDSRGGGAGTVSGLLRRSPLAQSVLPAAVEREELLVLTILNHPRLLAAAAEAFASLSLARPELDRLRNEILAFAAACSDLDRASLADHLTARGVGEIAERVRAGGLSKAHWFAAPEADSEDAERGWRHVLARHHKAALEAELEAECRAVEFDEASLARIGALKEEIAAVDGDEADLDGFGVASGQGSLY